MFSEVDGAMVRKGQEQPTKLQEGITIGRYLSYIVHENPYTNLKCDFRAPSTTTQTDISTNNLQQTQNIILHHADTGQGLHDMIPGEIQHTSPIIQ